ncbi:Hypoxic response protein 1 [Usitatibacter rugosus]|uniref:Hypoxic response protein 1 n=1 Tax=Usitatibacter rugosus TaxID=2732067 RepID=A0A6M4GVY2_9PROT|nr:CBS domain-containing protein [Usitatibacter rugosus]QJR10644.1 Hypoxic response protein 1 [Usitatibacter rugosus]
MNVRDVMTPNPRVVQLADSIQAAAVVMRDEDTGVVPVVDGGQKLVGVVTDRDLAIRAIADGKHYGETVREFLSTNLITATPDMSTADAAKLMAHHQVRRLPVVEFDMLVGIVSLGDLAVKEGSDRRIGDTLENISEGVKTTH